MVCGEPTAKPLGEARGAGVILVDSWGYMGIIQWPFHFRILNWRYLRYLYNTRPIYLACVREDPHRIWPNILKFPLNYRIIVRNYINPEVMRKMEWHRGKGEAIVTRPCLEMLQYVGHASGHAGAAELHTTRCKWWPSYFRCLM